MPIEAAKAIWKAMDRAVSTDDAGDPTGEILSNVASRSCLIVCNLTQFEISSMQNW